MTPTPETTYIKHLGKVVHCAWYFYEVMSLLQDDDIYTKLNEVTTTLGILKLLMWYVIISNYPNWELHGTKKALMLTLYDFLLKNL
jgi:hypothetical protein